MPVKKKHAEADIIFAQRVSPLFNLICPTLEVPVLRVFSVKKGKQVYSRSETILLREPRITILMAIDQIARVCRGSWAPQPRVDSLVAVLRHSHTKLRVTKYIGELEHYGFIESRIGRSTGHGIAKELYLSESGHAVLKKIVERWMAALEDVEAQLKSAGIYNRVVEGVRKYPGK